jgi:hypothetical protein
MFPIDFFGYQVEANRWAIPLNVEITRLYPARYQVYVSLLCLHLAFSVCVPRSAPWLTTNNN